MVILKREISRIKTLIEEQVDHLRTHKHAGIGEEEVKESID